MVKRGCAAPRGPARSHRVRAHRHARPPRQSALLNFKSFLVVMLLFICTATFVRQNRPSMFREKKPGYAAPARCAAPAPPDAPHTPARRLMGLVYKGSVIGTRLSPYVSLGCFAMAVAVLFF